MIVTGEASSVHDDGSIARNVGRILISSLPSTGKFEDQRDRDYGRI